MITPLPTFHEDLVHDAAYDFYGRSLATCLLDRHIKVFEVDPTTQQWELKESWKAHDLLVIKVAWALPEFGRVLALVLYDRSVRIWEEVQDRETLSGRRWRKMATLTDARGPLYDLAFAPPHLGLRLGAIGSDGVLRVYDLLSPLDLRAWLLPQETPILNTPAVHNLQLDFSIQWCPARFSPEKIVVCALDQGYIYTRDRLDKFQLACMLPEHGMLIRLVAWAPLMGRTYQLLATACKDGFVRFVKLVERPTEDAGMGDEDLRPATTIRVELLSQHNDHGGEVWRVSWNLTGTVLLLAGDDGKVRLWKALYLNDFKCMSVIGTE